jgi:protein-tyrosine phosphatase
VTVNRLVPFTEVFNFRDMGGYQTPEGRSIKWGQLYRSDVMHELTSVDMDHFRSLGIACIVDLRNPKEVTRTGRGLIGEESIHFINASVLSMSQVEEAQDTSVLREDYLWQRYLHYLDVGGDAFVQAIEAMADPTNYPLVFNCFFGKDRTGVLAAIVLTCLGVERQTIIEDYAITATRVPFILEKLARDPKHQDMIEQSDPLLFSAEPTTMARFLDEFDKRHGGPEAWLLARGVSEEQLASMRSALLE